MTITNHERYIIRQVGFRRGGRGGWQEQRRDWWLVKHNKAVVLGTVTLPSSLIGKKVRFRVQVWNEHRGEWV